MGQAGISPQGEGNLKATAPGAGRKIRSAAKNFSGRRNMGGAPRPEILFSLLLKDNFDLPSGRED
jgi:hypothetical protein